MDTTNVTRTRIRRTLRQMANNRSPITEQRRIEHIADALAHEQGEYTRLGEEVGIVGAESSLEREGMVILPDIDGPNEGNHSGDIYAVAYDEDSRPRSLHVVAAKGYSHRLRTRPGDGAYAPQGSPEHARHLMLTDRCLHAALAKDPVLRRGILDGSIEVIADVYRTPHPYMSSVIHPSAIPVPLDRAHTSMLQGIVRQHPDYTE